MPTTPPSPIAYRFGRFRLVLSGRILELDGERIPLTPKVVDTLLVLLENANQVVTKEQLMQAVWPDVTVVESGLTRNISTLRKALEAGLDDGFYLETIPRRGYRFLVDVQQEREGTALPDPPPAARTVGRRSEVWIWLLGGTVTVTMSLLTIANVQKAEPPISTDPALRIGEHLLYKLAPHETRQASEHFERAIANKPDSAAAHAGLSISLLYQAMLGMESLAAVMPRAEGEAATALRLDPRLSLAQHASASVAMIRDWSFTKAEAGFRRALELDSGSVQSRMGYAQLKVAMGDLKGARRLSEEALRMDPASPLLGAQYCRVLYYSRDFLGAAAECGNVLEREPHYALAHYYLALSLGSLNRFTEASDHLRKSGLQPGVVEADEAWLAALRGDRAPAERVLEARRNLIRDGKIDASAKLLPAVTLGLFDEAFEALDAGLRSRAPELLTTPLEPRMDSLHPDPRWQNFLAQRSSLIR
jgi:DNA-binding winged helix-turn-helix (wHTH) protein/Flp pilus assembly protein TadD